MALIGSIAINMQINTKGFNKSLHSGAAKIRAFGGEMAKAGAHIGGPVLGAIRLTTESLGKLIRGLISLPTLLAGGSLAGLFVSAARSAMDLFEQTNRAKIIFGAYSGEVISMSDKMAVAFGISKREFTAGASSFADIFRDAKYSEKDVAALSVHFNKLAIDMSSFYDIPIADALEKLHSGLAGNVKPLRDLGMSVYDETVKEYAYAHGIAKVGSELTSQQKIQTRAILINEKSSKAQGDLARTANSAANSVRSIAGRFENLKESIGTTLVGLLLPAFEDINVGLHAIQMSWDTSRYAADQATRDAIAGANGQAKGVGFVQRTIMYAADAWQSFKINALGAIISITGALVKLMDSLRMTAYLMLETGLQKNKTGFSRADYEKGIEHLQDFKRSLIKQKDVMEKTPLPSAGIADALSKAREDIEKNRKGLAQMPALNPMDLKPQTEAAKAGEPKFASAYVAGSSEATNAILKSRFGGGVQATKAPEQTARNTAEMVALMRRMVGGSREPVEIKGLTRSQTAAAGFLGTFF